MKRVSAKTIIRKVATIIGVLALAACAAAVVTIIIESAMFICFQGWIPSREEEKGEKYVVLRLNAESNIRGDEEDYVFRRGNHIIRYTLETGEAAEYHLETTEAAGRSGLIVGTGMYSVMPDGTIRRFDLEKQTDEEILSQKDICRMCGLTDLPDELCVSLTRAGKNWLLTVEGYDEEEQYYICPIDGKIATDCVEVNTLFPQEDRTGREQTVLYRGMRIRRSYDAEKERYCIIELGKKAGRPKLFAPAPKDTATIRVGGKLVSLGNQRSDTSYWVEGDSEEHKIGCLDADAFAFSVRRSDKLTTENGEIIGLTHAIKNFRCESWDPPQDELRYDVLFWLDPKTGENGILYSPWNNRTRIIGYQDGVIYLLRDFKIYSSVVECKEEKLIAELPGDTDYEFDWQGDYLIVIRRDGIYRAYKVQ